MSRQSMLFNIPKRDNNTQKILNKMKEVASSPVAISVTSASKLEATIQTARQLLKDRKNIRLVTDDLEIKNYVDLIKTKGIVAIDTETTGLNPIRDKVVGLCLYTPGEEGIYIPSLHKSHMTGEVRDGQVAPHKIGKILKDIQDSEVKQIYHNYKYDGRIIYNNYGVWMKPYWDTLLCSIILNENEPHGLKTLYNKYVDKNSDGDLSYDTLFDGFDFSMIPMDIAYQYAAYDPVMTYELYKFQEKVLERENLAGLKNTFTTIEMPLVPIIAEMEETGNCIDLDHANYLEKKYSELLDKALESVHGELNMYSQEIEEFRRKRPDLAVKLENPINIASPTQLAILLYDILKLKSSDKKKPRGTGKDILKEFDLPLTNEILNYRTIDKLMNTYILKLPRCIEPKTGRLHGTFNQGGTNTGRFSSSDPNLQNIPSRNKEIRRLFTAPPGYVMVGGDYSQQEPRCLAFLSQDEHLLDAYINNKDVYSSMASKIYNVPYEECKEFREDGSVNAEGKKRRSNVKSIVLGIMYGRQANSIAEQTGMSVQEAEALISDFFDTFSGIKQFIDEAQAKCRKVGYIEMIWGRKRRITDMTLEPYEFSGVHGEPLPGNVVNNYMRKLSNMIGKQKDKLIGEARRLGVYIKDNTWNIAQAERQVVNSIIQGSSAEITKKAMILIGTDTKLRVLGFRMVLTIHDEVVGICPKENAKECAERMTELMLEAPKDRMDIPMKVDIEVTECWYGEPLDI